MWLQRRTMDTTWVVRRHTEALDSDVGDGMARQVHSESRGKNSMVDSIFNACERTMNKVEGAYSCITLINQVGMFGFRDPHGIRPLVLGKRTGFNGNEWCLASEDCAFGPVGFERVRDIAPGEAVLITEDGQLLTRQVRLESVDTSPQRARRHV
jgi:glutamine phosphoribosylpyrophosphate amidotransferase